MPYGACNNLTVSHRCAFFKDVARTVMGQTAGECRVHAPALPLAPTEGRANWPIVLATDGCGEWSEE